MTNQHIVTELASGYRSARTYNESSLLGALSNAIHAWKHGKPVRRVTMATEPPNPTGYKAVDKLIEKTGIYSGNAITPLQFSTFVRAANNTECNGFEYERGHLARFDLNPFKNVPGILSWYKDFQATNPDTETCCYLVRESLRSRNPRHHGFFVLNENHQVLYHRTLECGRSYDRSKKTLLAVIREVTKSHLQLGGDVMRIEAGEIRLFDKTLYEASTAEFPELRIVLQ